VQERHNETGVGATIEMAAQQERAETTMTEMTDDDDDAGNDVGDNDGGDDGDDDDEDEDNGNDDGEAGTRTATIMTAATTMR